MGRDRVRKHHGMKTPDEVRDMQRKVRRGRTKSVLGDKGADKILNRMDNRLVSTRRKQRRRDKAPVVSRPGGTTPFTRTVAGAETVKQQIIKGVKKKA